MQAWVWWVFGLVCFGVETLTLGSFVFVFFGVAALVVGALAALDVIQNFGAQSVIFVSVAAASMVMLRRRLRRHMDKVESHATGDRHFAEMATAAEDIAPAQVGQVELRGTVWRGLNAGTTSLVMGQTYRVVRIDNLTVVLMDRGPSGALK